RQRDDVVRIRAVQRSLGIGLIVGICYTGLVIQAGRIMLTEDSQLQSKARDQFEQAIEIQGRRGDILDRDDALLATTAELFAIHADPSKLTEQTAEQVAEALSPTLDLDVSTLTAHLTRFDRRDVLLSRGLTPMEAEEVREVRRALIKENSAFRGLLWTDAEQRRFYPGRHQAAPIIGMVGHNGVGVAGLERTSDRVLRGERHKYVLFRDRKGRQVTPDLPTASPGNTVVLTLDRQIQHYAETALDFTMEFTGAEAAWVVVMDVKTGEILALANRPSQNPNNTTRLKMESFKNRAALDAYEPGSVFKPFIAAAALEEGLVTAQSLVNCENGAWAVNRRVIHDDHPKGVITVSEVIKYSSNIGAAKLAFKLGAERALSYLSDLGFGRSTGLSVPGETRGVLRSAHSIKPIELATTSYGHGVSVNAIQLVSATATLGNGGVRMEPRLIREVRAPDGSVLERYEPAVDRRVFSEETARTTLDMMVTVTQQGGTGTRAQVPGYVVAGKTGTAWKHEDGAYSSTDRIGSFVGLLPADDPRLAIVVTVDTPTIGLSYGGIVAGPAFSQIAAQSMRHLGIPADPVLLEGPEDEDGATFEEPEITLPEPDEVPIEVTWTPDGSLRVPDLTGMSLRDALATIQGSGLSVSLQGSGRITQQYPEPGTPLSFGDAVEVTLQ
ncbi:MAG: cell division protein FtsI (penicillin-binding protein 3), partial [Myxococcota bacterium]